MERARRLRDLWTWLPAFRAVAESQHLPTAASELHVSPSALCRSIANLEDSLGRQLFDRRGRGLHLNSNGELLLAALRDAMRRLDDGVELVVGSGWSGPLRVACSPIVESVVSSVLLSLRRDHAGLRPSVSAPPPEDPVTALLSGHVDVVVTPRAYRHPELVAAGLPPMPLFVWAAPSNPIAGSPVSCEELSAQAFVVLDAGAVHTAPDGWPAHLLRVEALVVPSISATIEACATAGLLAVLPALAPLQRAGLRRLEGPAIPPMPLVAIRRKDLTEENPPSMACMRLYHSLQAQVG